MWRGVRHKPQFDDREPTRDHRDGQRDRSTSKPLQPSKINGYGDRNVGHYDQQRRRPIDRRRSLVINAAIALGTGDCYWM